MTVEYDDPLYQYDEPTVSYDGEVEGGTVYEEEFTGEVGPTGNLVKRALLRLNAALGTAGALIRRTTLRLGGGVAPEGSLLRTARKYLTGSTEPEADLVLEAIKRFDGQLEPEAVVVKTATLHLGGGVEPSGSLTTTFISGGTEYEMVGGSVEPTGDLRLTVIKRLSGSAHPGGVMTIPTQRRGGLAGYAGPIIKLVTAYDPRTETAELFGLIKPSGHLILTTHYGTPRHMRHWEKNKRVLLAEIDEDLAELV